MELFRANRVNPDKLIRKFNLRDNHAFTEVYSMFYDSMHLFADKLFYGTEIEVTDLMQDIFISLWENKYTKFNSLTHIKGYLYLSIKNQYRNYLKHKQHVDKFALDMLKDDEYLMTEIVEIEVSSRLNEMLEFLPSEAARVLHLYLEGLDVKEIAKRLGKSESTVYNQKQAAISSLKKKFGKNPLYSLIFSLISSSI